MPKTKISEFSETPGDNTDINGINIDEGCSPANVNNAIRQLMADLKEFQAGTVASNQLAIAGGGTGATTAADARTNLGLGTMATQAASNVAITGGSIAGITDLALADGGTGASTAADARTNLGLGTIATQSASSVAITGGSVTGITDLALADGGTGASTAADARTNLNVPTRTGGDASGTWGISITGNAATATSATSATSATTATSATNVTGTVAVANGGTGSTSASGARTNLGLAIGSDIPSTTGSGASGTWSINLNGNHTSGSIGSLVTANTAANPANDNYVATNAFVKNVSLGWGQTWQDFTGSRALNTTYTNSTGKPIQVTCSAKSQQSSNRVKVIISGVTILDSYTVDCCGVPQISYFPLSFIVPSGANYRIEGNFDFSVWAELR